MKGSLYARLALGSIRKNRRLYLPYLLSGCMMVAVELILGYLTGDPAIRAMPGGASMCMVLAFGVVVMAVFSVIFLLYSSSFLLKQHSRELGLYAMLGMSRQHLARILLWETLLCAAFSIIGGLVLGTLLAKAFQLGLLRLCHAQAATGFSLSPSLLLDVSLIFAVTYTIIALRGVVHVYRSSPLALMRSSRTGERPPRAHALQALAGAAALLAGYVLAVTVKNPMIALTTFFIAVLLVILGTSLCFRSGSAYVLAALQANGSYYYHPEHFISVSGMRYRMTRCASSLTVICILSTMVLVTLSCSACLYVGVDDALRTQYKHEIDISLESQTLPDADVLLAPVEAALAEAGVQPENALACRSFGFAGRLAGDTLYLEDGFDGSLCVVAVIPLSDYNAITGEGAVLAPGEALALDSLAPKLGDGVSIEGGSRFAVTDRRTEVPDVWKDGADIVESLILVLCDGEINACADSVRAASGRAILISSDYAFDTGISAEEQPALASAIARRLEDAGLNVGLKVREAQRSDFWGTFSGFLFLGVMLSAAFLCAAVLSMYDKQITEGYEDQASFAIMLRVGLSLEQARTCVNAQMRAVFLLPLLGAGLHTAFAFPMLSKLLMLFGLTNIRLLTLVTLACYAVFAVFYTVVYRITSRTYYRLVTGGSP
ncbi:MAG: ABC transporter permease [Clostridiales bacterium]|nr:ABC transporter permease [Clostridiales bacterium]